MAKHKPTAVAVKRREASNTPQSVLTPPIPAKLTLAGKPRKSPAGRKPNTYTDEQIAHITDVALTGAYTRTIAAVVGLPEETVRRDFSALIHQKRAEHRVEVRKILKAQARSGGKAAAAAAIFLGKADCDMSETSKMELVGPGGVNIFLFAEAPKPLLEGGDG